MIGRRRKSFHLSLKPALTESISAAGVRISVAAAAAEEEEEEEKEEDARVEQADEERRPEGAR